MSQKMFHKWQIVLKSVMLYGIVFVGTFTIHYKMKELQHSYCTGNIIKYYLMRNSNLCRYLDTYSKLLESVISIKLDKLLTI